MQLQQLYTKFTQHYPTYRFGYRVTDLWISLSVMDRHGARKDKVNLDSTEQELKLAWYKLLKELQGSENPHSV